MNLYLLKQDENKGYETHDSCVVAASTEEIAKTITPSYIGNWDEWSSWASSPSNVSARLIGVAAENIEEGVVIASYNAG